MHTYIRAADYYYVGMWLPNREGITSFVRMFRVNNVRAAIQAVNLLNGGEYSSIEKFAGFQEEP